MKIFQTVVVEVEMAPVHLAVITGLTIGPAFANVLLWVILNQQLEQPRVYYEKV